MANSTDNQTKKENRSNEQLSILKKLDMYTARQRF